MIPLTRGLRGVTHRERAEGGCLGRAAGTAVSVQSGPRFPSQDEKRLGNVLLLQTSVDALSATEPATDEGLPWELYEHFITHTGRNEHEGRL